MYMVYFAYLCIKITLPYMEYTDYEMNRLHYTGLKELVKAIRDDCQTMMNQYEYQLFSAYRNRDNPNRIYRLEKMLGYLHKEYVKTMFVYNHLCSHNMSAEDGGNFILDHLSVKKGEIGIYDNPQDEPFIEMRVESGLLSRAEAFINPPEYMHGKKPRHIVSCRMKT